MAAHQCAQMSWAVGWGGEQMRYRLIVRIIEARYARTDSADQQRLCSIFHRIEGSRRELETCSAAQRWAAVTRLRDERTRSATLRAPNTLTRKRACSLTSITKAPNPHMPAIGTL
jgi:hypothetical protein